MNLVASTFRNGAWARLRQAAGDLGLADPGRADHQDVLRRDLVPQIGRHPPPAPAVAQGDGDGLLGLRMADDVAVELGDDLAGGKLGHAPLDSHDRGVGTGGI